MQEAGIVTDLLNKWTPQKKRCEPRDLTSRIHLRQIRTGFYMLTVGAGLALLTLTVEIWVNR